MHLCLLESASNVTTNFGLKYLFQYFTEIMFKQGYFHPKSFCKKNNHEKKNILLASGMRKIQQYIICIFPILEILFFLQMQLIMYRKSLIFIQSWIYLWLAKIICILKFCIQYQLFFIEQLVKYVRDIWFYSMNLSKVHSKESCSTQEWKRK